MNKLIIYNDDGNISILVPSNEALSMYDIDTIAKKDVPAGKPYKIINADQLPNNSLFIGAWEVDESLLTDGVGSQHHTFEGVLLEINNDNN